VKIPGRDDIPPSTNEGHVDRVRGNLRLTVREVAEEVGISIESCHQIFTEKRLMCRVRAKFVPRLLTDDQNRYLAKHQTSVVPHPPYSPDLAPADFFLFLKLKTTLKGCRFQTIEEFRKML
jgi:hypothetical protein